SPTWAELVGTCARLIREGKVLAWGALLDQPDDDAAPALLAEPWLAAVSVAYHLWERRAEPLFEAAVKRELALLARPPLSRGAAVRAPAPPAPVGSCRCTTTAARSAQRRASESPSRSPGSPRSSSASRR